MLALTFTRDAASELKRRLRRLELREGIEAGTFHSVALRLLRDRALTHHQAPPQIANDRLRLLRECIIQLQLRIEPYQAQTDIDWSRARLVEPGRYEAANRSERRRSAIPATRFAEFIEAYEQLKRRRGVVDFDDLLTHTLHALRTDPTWAEGVRWRYRHLFVDEAQDLNPLQHSVLEALRDGRPDLCLVGDPRQAIYGWNGADHTMLSEVEHRYPGITVVPLTVELSLLTAGGPGGCRGARGQRPTRRHPEHAGQRALGQRRATRRRARRGRGRGPSHARSVAPPIGSPARSARPHQRPDHHVCSGCSPPIGIATERTAGRSPLDMAVNAAVRCTNREQLAAWVDGVFADGDPVAQRVAEEADRFLTSGEPGTFRAWIDLRTPFDDLEHGPSDDAVALLTFHAAKGREWWGVVVAGAEEGLVPHSTAVSARTARRGGPALLRRAHPRRAAPAHHALRHPRRPQHGPQPMARRRCSRPSPTTRLRRPRPRAPPCRSDPMAPYVEWRAAIARLSGQPERAVCTDRVLRSLHDEPPDHAGGARGRLGITVSAAARLRPLPHWRTEPAQAWSARSIASACRTPRGSSR